MSEENVEVVRKYLDAINAFMRGELSSDDFEDLLDPQIEILGVDPGGAGGGVPDLPQHFRGIPEKMRIWEQFRSAWTDLVLEPAEVMEGPDDRVLTVLRQSGRGRESGIPIAFHFFLVFTLRGGKVCKEELFRHRAEALEAAGLRE
jgi:ketosteroid isomerase-like protein